MSLKGNKCVMKIIIKLTKKKNIIIIIIVERKAAWPKNQHSQNQSIPI